MKKFYIPYIVFCILILTLFVTNLKNTEPKDTAEQNPHIVNTDNKSDKIIDSEKNTEKKSYIVRADNDNVFLYDNDENVIKKLNIDYPSLREYDKNQFLNGIKFNDIQSVYQLIEDFSN